MRRYHRLSEGEREAISRGLSQGLSYHAIARQLGRHVSTISREVRKGSCNRWTYRAMRAQRRALRNARKRKADKHKLHLYPALWQEVQAKLRMWWSPEQIAKWLCEVYADMPEMQVSHEAIYSYLFVLPRGQLKAELLTCLRRRHKRRHRRRKGVKTHVSRGIEDMLSIEERPKEVEDRIIPGHWEGDLIIGRYRQSALGTLVERTTRTVLLVKLSNRQAPTVRKAFARKIKNLPQHMKLSMTYDQGREMAQHKRFTKNTQMKVYFAHPRSPWERGTNENTNGLIRQFFPKGTDFNQVSYYQIKKAQDLLNGRPRKVLGWKSPFEAMQLLLH